MRATRALLRHRTHLRRPRAARMAHSQPTTSQDHRPALGTKRADTAHREGVAERCDEPAVHKTMAIARERITADDERLSDLARVILHTATHHEAQTLSR